MKEVEKYLPEWVLETNHFSVIVTDLQGRYTYMNKVFEDKFAFISNDLVGKDSLVTIYEEDHDSCMHAIKRLFMDPVTPIQVLLRKPTKKADDFYWTQWEFSMLSDDNNEAIGVLCIGSDFTSIHKRKQRISNTIKQVDHLLGRNYIYEFKLDEDFNFTEVSMMLLNFLDKEEKDVLGKKIVELFPDYFNYQYMILYKRVFENNIKMKFREQRNDLSKLIETTVYKEENELVVKLKDISIIGNVEEDDDQFFLTDSTYNKKDDIVVYIDNLMDVKFYNHLAKDILVKERKKNIHRGVNFYEYLTNDEIDLFTLNITRALNGKETLFRGNVLGEMKLINIYPALDEDDFIIGQLIHILPDEELDLQG